MSTPESLFVEAWKAGVELSINGNKLHFEAHSDLPDELLEKLKANKPELMRFLSHWIDTPSGQAKFWGFLDEERCGVVLRSQPDRVTWMKRRELGIKPREEDVLAVAQGGSEDRWRKVEEWRFKREGSRMVGKRLDAPGEMSWEVKPSAPLENKGAVLQC